MRRLYTVLDSSPLTGSLLVIFHSGFSGCRTFLFLDRKLTITKTLNLWLQTVVWFTETDVIQLL